MAERSVLYQIKDYIQDVLEVISNIVDMQISVVDSNLIDISGTGMHEMWIDKETPRHGIMHKTTETGSVYFVTEPRECEECSHCANQNNCHEVASVSFPIKSDSKPIGAIGLSCFTKEEKDNLLNKKEYLLTFLEKLSELIVAKAYEHQNIENIKTQNTELRQILDCLSDGIIILDEDLNIVNNNHNSVKMLGIHDSDIKSQNIQTIVPPIDVQRLTNSTESLIYDEIYIENVKKSYVFLTSPIRLNNGQPGFTVVIKETDYVNRLTYENRQHKKAVTFQQIVGKSPKFMTTKNLAQRIAAKGADVLILGESGTGKEPFARAIHYSSKRCTGPFVAINCGAIPQELLESELFGYERGAFTGASKSGRTGKFEMANKGTLFLDEIGDMPLNLQVKLLRAIEERTIERIGGTGPIYVDIRIISATNKDLIKLISENKFREDLYYRLNIIPITIPPLRERREDIGLLYEFFVDKYSKLYDTEVTGITTEALDMLRAYDWPGNVRELENCIQYLCCTARKGIIDSELLKSCPLFGRGQATAKTRENTVPLTKPTEIIPIKELEYNAIKNALSTYGDTTRGKAKAATALGIGLTTLYRKITEYESKENK